MYRSIASIIRSPAPASALTLAISSPSRTPALTWAAFWTDASAVTSVSSASWSCSRNNSRLTWALHKRKGDRQGLTQKLNIVGFPNRPFGFFVGRILNQRIAFYVTRSSVQVKMQILDLTPFTKKVGHILLRCFLVDVGSNNDPPFNGCKTLY